MLHLSVSGAWLVCARCDAVYKEITVPSREIVKKYELKRTFCPECFDRRVTRCGRRRELMSAYSSAG